jgi:Flp pilus assembly protein CpaB
MVAPARPPRARASGGRTMMLLGVLLALAAGTIVIFIVSQATSTATQSITVVVAKVDLPAGTSLSVDTSDKTHMLISDAFTTKSVSADFAPQNAYTFTTTDAENLELNNKVVVGSFYAGEILRHPDPRLVPVGTGGPGSLTNTNPGQLQNGQVLMLVTIVGVGASNSAKPLAVPGDYVDIIATFCNVPGSKNEKSCESQTTLQHLYVYAVPTNGILVVVSHQDALAIQYIQAQASQAAIVLRKPGDAGAAGTQPVDASYIVKAFQL